jgi:hypothetical protein
MPLPCHISLCGSLEEVLVWQLLRARQLQNRELLPTGHLPHCSVRRSVKGPAREKDWTPRRLSGTLPAVVLPFEPHTPP